MKFKREAMTKFKAILSQPSSLFLHYKSFGTTPTMSSAMSVTQPLLSSSGTPSQLPLNLDIPKVFSAGNQSIDNSHLTHLISLELCLHFIHRNQESLQRSILITSFSSSHSTYVMILEIWY